MSVFLKTDTCICTELAEADIGVSDYPLQDATQLCCYLSVVELKQCCISSTLRLLSNFFCHFPFHAPLDNQDKRLVIKLCRYLDFQHLVGPSYVDTTFSLCCIFNSCAPHVPFWTHLHDIRTSRVCASHYHYKAGLLAPLVWVGRGAQQSMYRGMFPQETLIGFLTSGDPGLWVISQGFSPCGVIICTCAQVCRECRLFPPSWVPSSKS